MMLGQVRHGLGTNGDYAVPGKAFTIAGQLSNYGGTSGARRDAAADGSHEPMRASATRPRRGACSTAPRALSSCGGCSGG